MVAALIQLFAHKTAADNLSEQVGAGYCQSQEQRCLALTR
jgi:hypothetical protein